LLGGELDFHVLRLGAIGMGVNPVMGRSNVGVRTAPTPWPN
jgi:hypothetical protein